jgi:DeoR/GlpR family transcriptional regulator of sugar metabolism
MSFSSNQRQERIVEELRAKGHATVPDLAGALGVSEATVRRDLRSLAESGRINAVYGGATWPHNADYSFRSKGERNVEAKRAIGRLAADLIHDDDQIFLDSGTTCFEVARLLKRRRGLTVIVNSARLAIELESPGLNVFLIGGQYRSDRMDTVGPLAISAIDQLRGFIAFAGADGLSMDMGLSAADVETAHLNRLALINARECILVADHTKFLAPSLAKIVGWERISRVVTDSPPAGPWLEFFHSRGITVIHPATSSNELAPQPAGMT